LNNFKKDNVKPKEKQSNTYNLLVFWWPLFIRILRFANYFQNP
jgi:hypothetical protein